MSDKGPEETSDEYSEFEENDDDDEVLSSASSEEVSLSENEDDAFG